jgi:hypothetical protein
MIEVFYSCTCGIIERAVLVIARERDEEILSWMEVVMKEVKSDHRRRSPACPKTHARLRIPNHGYADFTGQETTQ